MSWNQDACRPRGCAPTAEHDSPLRAARCSLTVRKKDEKRHRISQKRSSRVSHVTPKHKHQADGGARLYEGHAVIQRRPVLII